MFCTADLIDFVARDDRPNRAAFLNLDARDFDCDPDRLGVGAKCLRSMLIPTLASPTSRCGSRARMQACSINATSHAVASTRGIAAIGGLSGKSAGTSWWLFT
jgi:hypothetical protein